MKNIIGASALLVLAACGGGDPVYSSFNREAGASLDNGSFGLATMNNTGVMSGERQFAYDLANRFASEVMTTVYFESNSAELDAGARDALNEQARWIRQFPEIRFRVYGHADGVGGSSYNKSLGQRRAAAVVNYLVRQGVSRHNVEAVASLGSSQPMVASMGDERRNRRAVTEVTGFVRNHPSVLNGQYAAIVYRDYVQSAGSGGGGGASLITAGAGGGGN